MPWDFKSFSSFPTQKGEGGQKHIQETYKKCTAQELTVLEIVAQLSSPSTKCHKATDGQYIAMYVIVSSYHASAGLRKGMQFISHADTHAHWHRTHLLMSVLKDGCQSWQQILNGWCHFCHTNDIHNCFQCSQNATQNFRVLLTQIFI